MGHYHDLRQALNTSGRELRGLIPGVFESFSELSRRSLEDGALPNRTKELIALAISVVEECDGCIATHARAAARSGIAAEEVAEALGIAILMAGGPGTVYAPRAWDAYQEFSRAGEAAQSVEAGEQPRE